MTSFSEDFSNQVNAELSLRSSNAAIAEGIAGQYETACEAREERNATHQGTSPSEVWPLDLMPAWGNDPGETCTAFIDTMRQHGFPGAETFTDSDQQGSQEQPDRSRGILGRLIRSQVTAPQVENSRENRWSVRGYAIGHISYIDAPNEVGSSKLKRDVYLCEDGLLRWVDGSKQGPARLEDLPLSQNKGSRSYAKPAIPALGDRLSTSKVTLKNLLIDIAATAIAKQQQG